ncbi:unnamed protein product [Callosobruchus maculatus]|uniref:Uncharacterized protein n=1 Tax=Callosobruchus maculatus TaxID=64391 RepID=A0A653DGN7_CALMS|nr:unnamed protein product [Callosobruchus maculatus]
MKLLYIFVVILIFAVSFSLGEDPNQKKDEEAQTCVTFADCKCEEDCHCMDGLCIEPRWY